MTGQESDETELVSISHGTWFSKLAPSLAFEHFGDFLKEKIKQNKHMISLTLCGTLRHIDGRNPYFTSSER